ncbi:hypothetical protein I3842_14G086700 [Carya illinoinensis]|uniref:Uncharacterized protein n=1 Tax=Carya illinoinensis TaxID=32201 RepID=A0A922D946_CARIL|nr:hypothetical protein I3842_14G086700 [Carya illinoinensis]
MFHDNPFNQESKASLMASTMCLTILDSIQNCRPTTLFPSKQTRGKGGDAPHPFHSMALVANSNVDSTNIVRRSANYHPTIWHYDYIQSLRSKYMEASFTQKIGKLKGEVAMMFHKAMEPLKLLISCKDLEYLITLRMK